jgi:hypothetical protein
MALTALSQIVTDVTRLLPLSNEPTTIVGNSDAQVRQLLALLQEAGDDLRDRWEWNALLVDWTFPITADPHTQALPADFNRFQWRADMYRSGSLLTPMIGPAGPNQWHRLLTIPGTFPGYWRRYGRSVQVTGVGTTETVTIPYISDNWILGNDGTTTKARWGADTDTPLIYYDLIELAGRWRWKHSKGLTYGEDFAALELRAESKSAGDRASRPITTAMPENTPDALRNSVQVIVP